jgi:hypothetical protein
MRTSGGVAALAFSGLALVVACTSSDGADPTADAGTPDALVEPIDAAPPPPPPKKCSGPAECESKICTSAGECAAAAPNDGVQNGDETDTDCGGAKAPRCAPTQRCAVPGDCTSGVCKDAGAGLACQEPSPTDGVKNGAETDVDCGGTGNPKCADTLACVERADCQSDVCTGSKCAPAVCNDGAKNGTETDIDCGGAGCPRCADLKTCVAAGDCLSGVCQDVGGGPTCRPPSPTDGVKNGTETDTDCGGAGNPTCAAGRACLAHADCQSDGCAYDGKCALRRSCTGRYGGDTCGFGGDGSVGAAAWESCCATAPAGNGGVQMNKYQVTAGRVRAFLTRVNGDVRGFVQQARANNALHGATLNAAWDLYLPTSMQGCDRLGNCPASELTDFEYGQTSAAAYRGIFTSAVRHVGGTIFNGQNLSQQGCRVDAPGTHSYWMDAATQASYFGDKAADYGQTVYDAKPTNCVNYLMAQAFCVWDGGRLETRAEYLAAGGAVDNGGNANGPVPWGSPVPWGQNSSTYFAFRFPTASDASLRALNLPSTSPNYRYVPPAGRSIEWANYSYSYEYPNLGANMDFIVFLSAPGRLRARSPNGHADLVGPMMEISGDLVTPTASPKTTYARWTANGSWEGHVWGYYGWSFSLLNKYGKQSLRCVYP